MAPRRPWGSQTEAMLGTRPTLFGDTALAEAGSACWRGLLDEAEVVADYFAGERVDGLVLCAPMAATTAHSPELSVIQ